MKNILSDSDRTIIVEKSEKFAITVEISRNLLAPNITDIILVDLAGFFTLAVGHFLPVSSLHFLGWYPIIMDTFWYYFRSHSGKSKNFSRLSESNLGFS